MPSPGATLPTSPPVHQLRGSPNPTPLVFGEGNGSPLQYSCLENPIDRRTWWATLHGVTRVRHDLATKLPPCRNTLLKEKFLPFFIYSLHVTVYEILLHAWGKTEKKNYKGEDRKDA